MRDRQVVSPPHLSKRPYTKPKERVLLQGIAYFKILSSNLTELLSVLSADSADEKCIFPATDSRSSLANH